MPHHERERRPRHNTYQEAGAHPRTGLNSPQTRNNQRDVAGGRGSDNNRPGRHNQQSGTENIQGSNHPSVQSNHRGGRPPQLARSKGRRLMYNVSSLGGLLSSRRDQQQEANNDHRNVQGGRGQQNDGPYGRRSGSAFGDLGGNNQTNDEPAPNYALSRKHSEEEMESNETSTNEVRASQSRNYYVKKKNDPSFKERRRQQTASSRKRSSESHAKAGNDDNGPSDQQNDRGSGGGSSRTNCTTPKNFKRARRSIEDSPSSYNYNDATPEMARYGPAAAKECPSTRALFVKDPSLEQRYKSLEVDSERPFDLAGQGAKHIEVILVTQYGAQEGGLMKAANSVKMQLGTTYSDIRSLAGDGVDDGRNPLFHNASKLALQDPQAYFELLKRVATQLDPSVTVADIAVARKTVDSAKNARIAELEAQVNAKDSAKDARITELEAQVKSNVSAKDIRIGELEAQINNLVEESRRLKGENEKLEDECDLGWSTAAEYLKQREDVLALQEVAGGSDMWKLDIQDMQAKAKGKEVV